GGRTRARTFARAPATRVARARAAARAGVLAARRALHGFGCESHGKPPGCPRPLARTGEGADVLDSRLRARRGPGRTAGGAREGSRALRRAVEPSSSELARDRGKG